MSRLLTPSRWIGVLLASLVLASGARGQSLFVRSFNEAMGLPSSTVFDVRQAPSGLLWFATRGGLHEYDGTSWEPVLTEQLRSVRAVKFVRFDAEGVPWALCDDGSVVCPRRPGLPGWGTTRRTSLWDFDVLGSGEEVLVGVCTSSLGLQLWNGSEWRAVEVEGALLRASAVEACFGQLFAGGATGLWSLAADGVAERIDAPFPSTVIRALHASAGPDGERLWILGEGWVGTLGPEGAFELLADDLPPLFPAAPSPATLVHDGADVVMYGTNWGIYLFDLRERTCRRVDRRHGLVGDGVNALYRDGSGILWGATDLGAFKIVTTDVQALGVEDGLLDAEVTAVAEWPDGTVVLGHYGGLSIVKGEEIRVLRFARGDPDPPSFRRVMDLHVDDAGILWIAGAGMGLGRLEPGGETRWTAVPDSGERWANTVHSDPAGRPVVGTPRGLFRLHGDELVEVREPGLDRPFVRRLEICRDGTAYVATTNGVLVRRPEGWRRLGSPSEPSSSGHFFTAFEDRAGTIWLGGTEGLWQAAGDRLVRPDAAYEVRRPVYALTEDRRGRLWIGTDHGVVLSDGESLMPLDWMADFTGYETNRAAALLDRGGAVWMGTTSGVTVFEPAFRFPLEPPPLELRSVEVGSVLQDLDGVVRMDTGDSQLAIRLRALTFWPGDRIEFRTRVVGFTEWETTVGSTVLDLRYTGLPHGRYRLEAQARTPGGRFGPVVRSPWIEVVGPVWTRWWFLASAIAMIVGVAGLAQRAIMHRRHALRLEKEIEARTRELQTSLTELAKTDRLRALGLLAGGIAHDFRNVLTSIVGNVSMLRQGRELSTENAELLDATDRALERATQLASQLQTFATGGAPVTGPIAIGELAGECATLVLSGSRVAVELDFPEDLWPAEADQGQIRQVLENLLVNARQCQEEGGRVSVQGENVWYDGQGDAGLPPGRYVRVSVTDDGPGIPDDVAPRIFDPFYTTKAAGSGLGLATALSVVRRHGGGLDVSPAEGGGTTFRLLLPASESPVSRPAEPPEPGSRQGAGRVLVVDDEAGIRQVLVQMLAGIGYEARAAGSCEEAVRTLEDGQREERPFHFAIVDLTLPGDLSGPEILEQLRRRAPELRAVASSGHSESAALARFDECGFQAALPKPYRLADLSRVMQELGTPASA